VTVLDPTMQPGAPSASSPTDLTAPAASAMPLPGSDSLAGGAAATRLATGMPAHDMITASSETTVIPAAATTREAELADHGGCSVASRGGSSPASVLGIALLGIVVRRRGRRSATAASVRKAA
jgi:hypothetical protein